MTIIKHASSRRGLTRRSFLKSGASTAALLGAVGSQFPFGVPFAQADGPEVTKAKATDGLANPGPVICAVGLNTIRAAIDNGSATTVDDIGTALRAGTNCGSCLPELKRIVSHGPVAQTA